MATIDPSQDDAGIHVTPYPVIEPGHTFGSVTDKISSLTLQRRTPLAWFIGFGIGASILPLLYTEKGMQMSFIVRAVILLVSGVYYPVSVMPQWMQLLASISPGTYVIQGMRAAMIDGALPFNRVGRPA